MSEKTGVWQGTLALMVLTTLEALGPEHGYGIARRIEQTSGDRLSLNPGTSKEIVLTGKASRIIEAGDTFQLETAGGGGYGPAAERTSAEHAKDRELGYVTESAPEAPLTRPRERRARYPVEAGQESPGRKR